MTQSFSLLTLLPLMLSKLSSNWAREWSDLNDQFVHKSRIDQDSQSHYHLTVLIKEIWRDISIGIHDFHLALQTLSLIGMLLHVRLWFLFLLYLLSSSPSSSSIILALMYRRITSVSKLTTENNCWFFSPDGLSHVHRARSLAQSSLSSRRLYFKKLGRSGNICQSRVV